MNSHEKQHHAGPEQTKRLVRNTYWILGGKRAISSILSKCPHQECVSKRLKPVIQAPPSLPAERLANSCFEYISIDACGPFEMKLCGVCNYSAICSKCNKKKSEDERKEDEAKKNCKTKKVWITLYACMVTRCVNLELVQDKTCESFLMSLQRHYAENEKLDGYSVTMQMSI